VQDGSNAKRAVKKDKTNTKLSSASSFASKGYMKFHFGKAKNENAISALSKI
jgi:hypothetical protein